ncbi:MAG: hypothetical protein HQL25_04295 [Candidatus Omnitrophica bacterium]|nr:hypothetical protein [Candidatus Omnitrophota bacterium]
MKSAKHIFLVAYLVFCSSFVWAQAIPDASIFDAIRSMKEKAQDALKENQKLQEQYDRLLNKKSEIERRILEQKAKATDAQQNAGVIRQLQTQEQTKIQDYRKQIDSVQNDVLIHQTKNLVLKKQMLDMDEVLRGLKLKFADLQYEKRTLELDQKISELGFQDTKHSSEAELLQLRHRLDELKEQERTVLLEINNHDGERSNVLTQAEKLAEEISGFEKDYSALLDQKKQIVHKKKISGKSDKLVEMEQQIFVKEKELKALQDEVQKLEKEYADVDGAVRDTIEKQNSHQQMVQDIIALDKENQMLREQIAAQSAK